VSEDFEKKHPEPEAARQDDEDVEAHRAHPAGTEDKVAATEEGPDVEAHRLAPKHHP
jgi:hypothetical protein